MQEQRVITTVTNTSVPAAFEIVAKLCTFLANSLISFGLKNRPQPCLFLPGYDLPLVMMVLQGLSQIDFASVVIVYTHGLYLIALPGSIIISWRQNLLGITALLFLSRRSKSSKSHMFLLLETPNVSKKKLPYNQKLACRLTNLMIANLLCS